ncbi:hypothetical protein [Thalassococcus lentus]|uniref:Uncharacterized protein n=1 Tax=Thalassococcus lentus TaxID=1210524 RepID=A0ABT4XXX0_9RHOB|nr:hypothetical protein [Thalassococcus lentus]MDA7426658.1 hypothetical protein [Thalassococcus lentus]
MHNPCTKLAVVGAAGRWRVLRIFENEKPLGVSLKRRAWLFAAAGTTADGFIG